MGQVRAAGHRLDRNEAKRLRPGAEHDSRQRARVERVSLGLAELSQEFINALGIAGSTTSAKCSFSWSS
jgi:hypothetical protein